MDCSTSGFPVLHHLPEFAPTHIHWVSDAIQPSHPLLSPPLLGGGARFQILSSGKASFRMISKTPKLWETSDQGKGPITKTRLKGEILFHRILSHVGMWNVYWDSHGNVPNFEGRREVCKFLVRNSSKKKKKIPELSFWLTHTWIFEMLFSFFFWQWFISNAWRELQKLAGLVLPSPQGHLLFCSHCVL